MKKLITIFVIIITGACSGCHEQRGQDKVLVVSILPIKYLIDNISGGDFTVKVLVPPGASPETYEPTPSQMMDIAESEIIFFTGLIDFEKHLFDKINSQRNGNNVVDLSLGIDLIEGESIKNGHSGHAHGVDPHIWASPRNLKIMARTVYNSLALFYPDSIKYKDHFERLEARIDSVDIAIGQYLISCKSEIFVIYHPAFTYYARDYGLRQICLEEEGKEPSADKIKRIITDARNAGVVKLFYQKQFSPATVETVASEMGAKCVEVDPLKEDVLDNLLEVTRIIAY